MLTRLSQRVRESLVSGVADNVTRPDMWPRTKPGPHSPTGRSSHSSGG
jgi:hypothetical protein